MAETILVCDSDISAGLLGTMKGVTHTELLTTVSQLWLQLEQLCLPRLSLLPLAGGPSQRQFTPLYNLGAPPQSALESSLGELCLQEEGCTCFLFKPAYRVLMFCSRAIGFVKGPSFKVDPTLPLIAVWPQTVARQGNPTRTQLPKDLLHRP